MILGNPVAGGGNEAENGAELPVLDPEATELDLNHSQISSMTIFSELTKLEFLGLRNNLIKKIEGLTTLSSLRELELYDNQITKIENLNQLVNLE